MSIESICNQALDIVGYKRHIGSIWDGSRAARIALNAWAETRDALLVKMQPDWARQDTPLLVIKTAPNYSITPWTASLHPDLPWLYEYSQPSTCLVPLAIKPRPATLPVWRPRDARFRIKAAGPTYTLLGNDPAPILTCIVEAPDVETWYQDFAELMVEMLAKKFQTALGHGAPPQAQEQQQPEGGGRANAAR